MTMTYKVEVIADNSGEWCGNGREFATWGEAAAYALDVTWRWASVRDWRVVEVEA